MTRFVGLSALFLVAYLGLTIAQLPVRHAYGWVADALPVQLFELTGTPWAGEAQGQLRGFPVRFDRIEWRWRPTRLLRGDAEWGLRLRGTQVTAALGLGVGIAGVYGRDIKMVLPASLAGAVADLDLGGQLSLDLSEVALGPQGLPRLDGTIAWQDAAIAVYGSARLGNLRFVFTRAEGGSVAQIRDEGGALEVLEGELMLRQPETIVLEARVRPRAEASSGLVNGLRALGREAQDGSIVIEQSYTLTELSGA